MTKGDLIRARSIIQCVTNALFMSEIDRRAAACSLEIALKYLETVGNDSSETCDFCRGHSGTCPNRDGDLEPTCVDDI